MEELSSIFGSSSTHPSEILQAAAHAAAAAKLLEQRRLRGGLRGVNAQRVANIAVGLSALVPALQALARCFDGVTDDDEDGEPDAGA